MEFKVLLKDEEKRLDVFLCEKLHGVTRSRITKHIKSGNVKVNTKVTLKAGAVLELGDTVSAEEFTAKETDAKPEEINLNIVYEDEHLLVINKPQGMVVHPAAGNFSGTLVNALVFKYKTLSDINGKIRPGILHRLDKDTGGLMVVAKTNAAHANLSKQLEKHKDFKREYLAIAEGVLKENSGTIKTLISRSGKDRKKMEVNFNKGKEAITHFKVEKRFNKHTLVRFILETGRTHQIRVHAAYLNHPVACDTVYGFKKPTIQITEGKKQTKTGVEIKGQLLASVKLEFIHPFTNKKMNFEIEPFFEDVLKRI